MTLRDWLLYITNNEKESRHEQAFDIAFFLINTVALILGVIFFIMQEEFQWIPFLVIEYVWAFDSMRHKRLP